MNVYNSSGAQNLVYEVSCSFCLANHLLLKVIAKIKVDVLDSFCFKVVGKFFGCIHNMSHSAMVQQLSFIFASMLVSEIEPFYYEVYVGIAMALHCCL